MSKRLKNLYRQPLPSNRTGIFYNTFAYPTKISPESVAVYIAAHTRPGDMVLDVFGGSGSTGLAALMCEHPTEKMISLAKKLGVKARWGARNACIYEVGSYGAFASRVMCHAPDSGLFAAAAEELIRSAQERLGTLYKTVDDEGKPGVLRHVVWSDLLCCPGCGAEFSYYRGMVRWDPMRIDRSGRCPHCGHEGKREPFIPATETVPDPLINERITRKKRVPVRIYGQTGGRKWSREAGPEDLIAAAELEELPYPPQSRPKRIEWGELFRAGYHCGVTHLHHFYTRRNFLVMEWLWEEAGRFEQPVADALRLLLLSYNASHATLMTRVVVKKNSRDFVLTGAQSGILYISSLPVEKNILAGIRRKLGYFVQAFDYLNRCAGRVEVFHASSEHLRQEDGTVDYVFTDPPFGDFIPYAEVNQINELWLDDVTHREQEIIISPSQNKGVERYREMMTAVFREIYRVTKDEAPVTVAFHSSKAAVWNALSAAYAQAGFTVSTTATLDKTQASFKQVVSDGSVQGDPLLLLVKGKADRREASALSVLNKAIRLAKRRGGGSVREIYSDYVGRCLQGGLPVELDAKTAYAYIQRQIGETHADK